MATSIVRGYPRLHACLIDLSEGGLRRYGGAGFCIAGPALEVLATPSLRTEMIGLDALDARARADVHAAIDRFTQCYGCRPVTLHLRTTPPQHVGLGSKTCLMLSVLKALEVASGLSLDAGSLQRLSRRGGASGIGINGFFLGGFLTDSGHEPARTSGFGPSSSTIPTEVPQIVVRQDIPTTWRFHLVRSGGIRMTGVAEAEFFARNTPISRADANETMAAVYHGLAPAVRTANLGLLHEALVLIHGVGFKRCEAMIQPEGARQLLDELRAVPDCGAGVSSFGPTIYVIGHADDRELVARLRRSCSSLGMEFAGTFGGHNSSYELLEEDLAIPRGDQR